jgi:protein-glucosylgalactosylhydroxylysine glucosidase
MLAAVIAVPGLAADPIDRTALVRRHNPVVRKADAVTPLSLGNGAFAVNVDITGLQTFAGFYDKGIPLCMQSYWGWHTFPNPDNYRLEDTLVDFDTYGRMVKYATNMKSKAGEWLRSNPHRLGLGRIGLELIKSDKSPAVLEDLRDINQTLDLWSGLLTSLFSVEGSPVEVHTCCHPDLDAIAVRIDSPLVAARRLRVTIAFPYGSGQFGKEPGDWDHPELHETTVTGRMDGRIDLHRRLDADEYRVSVGYSGKAELQTGGPHHYELVPEGACSSLECVVAFSPTTAPAVLPSVDRCRAASKAHWKRFWSDGGAIDLSSSEDPRAHELERRIVLSQYLMAIQCAGPMPPPETGLTFNSWYGKPHLECHWWHGVQFALWNRLPLLERSLPWYRSILPAARGTASLQGYSGARWPKMVGPDGREGPSVIAPLLIWQQPHPIYYAELCYRAHPSRETLELYKDIIFETAEFMASYAVWEKSRERYVLGPPVVPAQENYDAKTVCNPTYELAYWEWGLMTAQKWRERLGLNRDDKWEHVIRHLSKLPVKDGLYLTAESVQDTWSESKWWRDHPSLLAACGMLPGTVVDRETMRRTLRAVMEKWNWGTCWGWDFPMVAMTAARIGEPGIAIDAIMMKTPRNHYLPNGHNYLHNGLPAYLTGNGSLLAAVAMMAGRWDGAPDQAAPGFPKDGSWSVRWENLRPMP